MKLHNYDLYKITKNKQNVKSNIWASGFFKVFP